MKQTFTLFLLAMLWWPVQLSAQLPDGSTAPDFTLTDINGQTHHLYGYLAQGKVVALDFSATWCGPCWNYMISGAMETFWEEHGPNGDNTAQALFIEADENTGMEDLLGNTGSSQGNWIANIPFPIIDIQPQHTVDEDYDINYYPTLYMVCTDMKVYEVGQIPASQWEAWITSCMLAGSVTNIVDATCGDDGSVTLDVDGGIAPIEYEWSNGSSGASLQNAGGGVYAVTITEANGKDVVISNIVVDGPSAPMSLATSDITNATCYEEPSGSVDIEIEEGTAPYSYDWSNGDNTEDLDDVTAGSYSVVVTDDNGCEFTETFEVDQPDAIEANSELTPEYCQQVNGTVVLDDISGGNGGYEVFSSEGTVMGYSIVDLPAGFVTVTIEDNSGCTWEEEFEIEEGPEPDLFFTPDPEIDCIVPTTVVIGYVTQGSGEYTYTWTTTDGHIVGPNNQNSITVDAEGTYTLTMYDLLTECTAVGSSFVEFTGVLPAVSAGADVPMTCETPEITLAGEGDSTLTVTWTTDDGNIVSGANTYMPVINLPGTYTITVYNPVNQCTNSDDVFVPNNQEPATAGYAYQTAGLTFVGTDTSGGSNLTTWNWSFGDGNSSNEQNPVHPYALPGTYVVCLTVENGCGSSQTCQTIEVMSSGSVINVNASIGNVLCYGDSTGMISIDVSGGSGNYTYVWTGPGGSTYTTPAIEEVPAGVYILIINDDQGNIFSGVYTVTQPEDIVLVGSTVADNTCFGQPSGSISVDITGGVPPYTFMFNNNPPQASNTIQNLSGGQYTCMVVDTNGCGFLAGPYTIAEPPAVTLQAAITGVNCFGESNGGIFVNANGGVAPYTYLWPALNLTDTIVSGLVAGSYTCQITDQNGCVNSFSVDVPQPEPLTAVVTEVSHATGAGQDNGRIIIAPLGGTAPYIITWSNGATGDTISGLVPGAYTYSLVDAHGCTFAAPAPIIISESTSASPVLWASSVGLTPNPSHGEAMVTWTNLPEREGYLQLCSTDGRILGMTELNARSGRWDITGLHLQPGLYLVSFRIRQDVVTLKLIVQ